MGWEGKGWDGMGWDGRGVDCRVAGRVEKGSQDGRVSKQSVGYIQSISRVYPEYIQSISRV